MTNGYQVLVLSPLIEDWAIPLTCCSMVSEAIPGFGLRFSRWSIGGTRDGIHRVGKSSIQAEAARSIEGHLAFGSILESSGIAPSEVLLLRHTFKKDGLRGPEDLTPEKIMAYAREQSSVVHKFPKAPPRIWLNFIAAGGTRCRFIGAYENRGESETERSETRRFYNIIPSDHLATFRDRLVIDWGTGAINWAKRGESGIDLRVCEIADSHAEAFPGFENLLLGFAEPRRFIEDSRYGAWREVPIPAPGNCT